MRLLGRIALGVVAGGIALGAMLGAAANPVMKRAPEEPWRGALQAPVTSDAGYLVIAAPPQDLSPYRDSYAPTWAREEFTNWEPEYPAWTYSDLGDEQLAAASEAEEASIDAQQVATAAEAAASPEIAPEPVVPADLALQAPPAGAAPHPRVASHLDDLY
jgi:hypothetical protein